MRFEKATDTFGAFVHDVDLRSLSDDEIGEIDSAWATYGVLFFEGQSLTPEDHLAFAGRLGEIDVNRFFTPVEGYPGIAEVLKEPDDALNIGGVWHTDHSYDVAPARGSILVARDLPPVGGDTQFLSVEAAYNALSDDLKERIRAASAVHSNEHIFGGKGIYSENIGQRFTTTEGVGSTTHPVVVAHPVTGAPLLYVNPGFTIDIVDLPDAGEGAGKALLDELLTEIDGCGFDYRYTWSEGSVAMWDNRSTWHWAMNDYAGHRRHMHRITIAGEPLQRAA